MQEPCWIQIVRKCLLNIYCPQSSQIRYISWDYFEFERIKFWRNSKRQGSHVLMLLPWNDHMYCYCCCRSRVLILLPWNDQVYCRRCCGYVYDTLIGTFPNIHVVLINCQIILLHHGEKSTKLWCFRILFSAALLLSDVLYDRL